MPQPLRDVSAPARHVEDDPLTNGDYRAFAIVHLREAMAREAHQPVAAAAHEAFALTALRMRHIPSIKEMDRPGDKTAKDIYAEGLMVGMAIGKLLNSPRECECQIYEHCRDCRPDLTS